MVPCRPWKSICEYTGKKRIRLVKAHWFGFRIIVESERRVEYRTVPDMPGRPGSHVLRTELEWFPESPWNVLGRNFYVGVP